MEDLPLEIIQEIRKYLPNIDYYRSRQISSGFNIASTPTENKQRYQYLTELDLAIRGDLPGLKFIGIQNPSHTLKVAAANARFPLLRYLVEELKIPITEDTMHGAAIRGQTYIIAYLMENAPAIPATSAFKWALSEGQLELIDYLVKNYKLNPSPHDLLRAAIYHRGLVEYLIEHWSFSPAVIQVAFENAIIHNQRATIEYLVSKNARITTRHLEIAEIPSVLETLIKLKPSLLE